MNAGDTAWVLGSAALVLFMTPGLALFYGGMVRGKNALATIMQSFAAMAVIALQWMLFGYSLAFARDHFGFVGGLNWVGLEGVGVAPAAVAAYGSTIPQLAHMAYQCMFAVITPALIAGAFAERMRFSAYLLFIFLWATLVYDPVAHWIWGAGGWLNHLGMLDFAGGTVVHITSGVTALVCALMMGRRKGYPDEEFRPHNLTMTLIGTGILWFGWFGFNAGSALAANGQAALAFVATNASAAAGAMTWMLIEWKHRGSPTALGTASGAVAGLAGVTQAAGFVSPRAAMAIGVMAGALCYLFVAKKTKWGYDDSLDTFGVHGVAGILGALATGVFASQGARGLLYGNPSLFGVQCIGVLATVVYSVAVSFVLLKALDATLGLRVSSEDESAGLDLSQHGETAYNLL
ncbi:MAG TPA: ammonium transporter [Armatimonadota bacterium]